MTIERSKDDGLDSLNGLLDAVNRPSTPRRIRKRTLTADQIRRLRVILRRGLTPWMANSLCSLALKGLKK